MSRERIEPHGAAPWSSDQYWEYVSGLVGDHEASQMWEMMASQGLQLVCIPAAGMIPEEHRVTPGREDWYLLAHEIAEARNAYLEGFGQQGNAERKAKLEELLWNDKGSIVEALRIASLPARHSPAENGVTVEQLADWFYDSGHEFVISDEEEVARKLLDDFEIRRRMPLPSREDENGASQ